MISDKIKSIIISTQDTLITTLKKMDECKLKLLMVMEDNEYKGLVSIGDLQRAIIENIALTEPVVKIMRVENKVASVHDSVEQIKAYMKSRRNDFMPIIDDAKNVIDVIFWAEIESEKQREKSNLNLPVIIMAGGQGTRLRPLTNILPKSLIPIGEQTMLEDIMDRFVECGCDQFHVSVNYKADTIKRYFDNLNKPQYHISYFQEDKPLGTAGSIHLLNGQINSTFFVSNCDSILDDDYSEILKYHRDNHNEITVIAVIKNMSVPYGTLETKEDGLLSDIKEKPEFTFKINTGFYILEPHLIKEIPVDTFYHITFLIEKLVKEGRRVGVYPVNEGSWIDVGNWDEYMKQFINK